MNPRVQQVTDAAPPGGLFDAKTWKVSPEAFPLDAGQVEDLEQLGQRLWVFLKACNLLYRRSVTGDAPEWIARWMDAGKPADLVEISRSRALKNELPRVLRPDLLLTDDGWAMSELDSLPGGIGLTAWLNQTYAALGDDVIGGPQGLRDAMHRLHPVGPVVVAQEAATYRPEFEWLFGVDRVKAAETYSFDGQPVYRFFEAFDWPNLPTVRGSWSPEARLTPPLKPFLEEKLWLALYWMNPLREFWRKELGERYQKDLDAIIPRGWVVDPTPLPPHAVLPGLEVQSWEEVMRFSQKQRDLVLKISGFSALAWGSRGVTIGSDVSQEEWAGSLRAALDGFDRSPFILQRFHKARVVEHPYWDADKNEVRVQRGRARICPYYVVENDRAHLRGVLVTIVPADKKIIHGMSDAILVPARMAGNEAT
ncbi:MAG: hypothetical protein SFU85_11535 [Candidatus Methylacidiphilales bacterium]|nr:hypothetical protein [Candidatus Methylacidiphilales bacterium]